MKMTWPKLFIAATLLVAACNPETDPQDPADMGGNNGGADVSGDDVSNNNGVVDMNIDEGCQVLGCPDNLVCNSLTGICVDCVTDAECGANGSCDPVSNKCSCDDGFHLCDSTCSPNDSVDSCGTSCDPCPTDPNGTASCDGSQCSLTCTAPLVLDPVSGACVGCAGNGDCAGPAASVCGAGGTCEACVNDGDCSHITGRGMCDSGTCVECSDEDDSACAGNSCLPDGTCSTTPKDSVGNCEPCAADTECMPGSGCVPMNFMGAARTTGFCLEANVGGCTAPFSLTTSKTTVSGRAGVFCGFDENLTTCEAIADFFANCADDSDCGAPGLDDGLCEPIEFEAAKCTYRCDDFGQCPDSSLIGCATGDVGMKWCGAY